MLTKHAIKRMQQRGISTQVTNCIIDYGEEGIHMGGVVYRVTKKLAAKMIKAGVPRGLADKCRGKYVVLQGGMVVTVAHITKRHI